MVVYFTAWVIYMLFFIFSSCWVPCAHGENSTISETAPVTSELYARHYTCLNKIYTVLCEIQDYSSANAAVRELTELRQECRNLEYNMRLIPQSGVSEYTQYVRKGQPLIRKIFTEEERLDRHNFYNSSDLKAIFVVAPSQSVQR